MQVQADLASLAAQIGAPLSGTACKEPRMLIHRIYAVSMKKLRVTLKGCSDSVTLEAAKVVDDEFQNTLTAFNEKDEKVGHFILTEIAGWWLEE